MSSILIHKRHSASTMTCLIAFLSCLCYNYHSMAEISPEGTPNPTFYRENILMAALVRALEFGEVLESQANTDYLTGLDNRRVLDRTFRGLTTEHPERRARSTEQPAYLLSHSLLLIDLDHFKGVNDKYGHEAGDDFLKTTAGILTEKTRERDLKVRFGGEEFALLLPGTPLEGALQVAEKVREGIEETGITTTSVGVVEIDRHAPLKTNLRLADLALYTAKDRGRNQVISFEQLFDERLKLLPNLP